MTRNGHSVSRNAHSVSRNGNFKQLYSHFIIVYILFPGFYPLNSIVLDKNRLFYPVQRVYWIKSCIADDYLRNGGYPETIDMRSITRNYLSTLFDSIIWKDVCRLSRLVSLSQH